MEGFNADIWQLTRKLYFSKIRDGAFSASTHLSSFLQLSINVSRFLLYIWIKMQGWGSTGARTSGRSPPGRSGWPTHSSSPGCARWDIGSARSSVHFVCHFFVIELLGGGLCTEVHCRGRRRWRTWGPFRRWDWIRKKESRRVTNLGHWFPFLVDDWPRFPFQVDDFLMQLEREPLVASAAGYFDITRSLLVSVCLLIDLPTDWEMISCKCYELKILTFSVVSRCWYWRLKVPKGEVLFYVTKFFLIQRLWDSEVIHLFL